MSVNIYKKETDTLQKVAGYGKIDSWTGTQAEFDALDKSTLSNNCYINITDDIIGDSIPAYTQAEWDNLSEDEKPEVGSKVIIKDDYIESDGDIYSTNEIMVGRWIDGKPIYRKVLLCATETKLDTAGTWTVVSGWSETPSDIKEFVRIDTSGVSLGNRIDFLIQEDKTLKFYSLASYLYVRVGNKLILEYTKTTD